MRRIPAVVAIVIGAVLVVGVFAMSGFSKASAGANLIDDARPSVSKAGIVRFRADLEELKAGAHDTVNGVFPSFAQATGVTDAEFKARVRTAYPALATAVIDRGDEILGSIEKGVSNLEAHQSDYEAADDIPVAGLPVTVMPWFTLILGVVLIGVGILGWRRPSRGTAAAIVAIGLGMAIFTVATRLPDKTHKSERLMKSLSITDDVAHKTRDQFNAAVAGGKQLRPFLNDFATALGQGQDEFNVTLTNNFPGLARVLGDNAVFDRIEGEVVFRETHVDEFAQVKDQPMELISWLFVVMGLVLALSTIPVWLGQRRGPSSERHVVDLREAEAMDEGVASPVPTSEP
jgi:hypothetical protein